VNRIVSSLWIGFLIAAALDVQIELMILKPQPHALNRHAPTVMMMAIPIRLVGEPTVMTVIVSLTHKQ
jgi:hypothetical protein